MILTHRIQIKRPNQWQVRYFRQAAGVSRFVWNWAVAEWNRQYESGVRPSSTELRKQFTKLIDSEYPWVRQIDTRTYYEVFGFARKAFQGFFKRTYQHPQFKSKHRSKSSFYLHNLSFRINGKRLSMHPAKARLGPIRLCEELKLDGKIMSATVFSDRTDRWYLSVRVDVGSGYQRPRTSDGIVGVDLGIRYLATLSDGQVIDGPKPLKTGLELIKRRHRQFDRKQKGSQNREKARVRLANAHRRVANQRLNSLHQLSSKLCRENQTIVIEDLKVENLIKNYSLSRSIGDMGWGVLGRQLTYKALLHQGELVVADRFFPSTQRCSDCGNVKTGNDKLTLSDRVYRCPNCNLKIDRDLNAAKNLEQYPTINWNSSSTHAHGELTPADKTPLSAMTSNLVEAGTPTIGW